MTTELKCYQDPVPHYRWVDIQKTLTDREKTAFRRWMTGQTCCQSSEGGTGVYKWDYERWLSQGMKSEQGRDWD